MSVWGGNFVAYTFQSTPSRRGRPIANEIGSAVPEFQSTPSRRGRRRYTVNVSRLVDVSIHALAKRATPTGRDSPALMAFQSTPSRRGRRNDGRCHRDGAGFQSTPSRRGRRCAGRGPRAKKGFNPRPREEGYTVGLRLRRERVVSIHALAKRATGEHVTVIGDWQFQSTPSRRGRRRGWHGPGAGDAVSIHALAKRATRRPGSCSRPRNGFNPRPREEGDRAGGLPARARQVSIHALAKRATNLGQEARRG